MPCLILTILYVPVADYLFCGTAHDIVFQDFFQLKTGGDKDEPAHA